VVAPWVTTFVKHPGPHRRRRVALVALLALLVYAFRALASILGRRTSATTDTAARAQEARQLRRVGLTAALAIAGLVMTAGQIAAG
jgi:hypothetical protein